MKKINLWLWQWSPPVLFMAIIFYLSSQHSVQVSTEATEDFLAHKAAHVIEYSILTFLFFRAFHLSLPKRFPLWQQLLFAAVCTVIFAMSDELHQLFVPSRTGRIRDVFIDGIGISLVVLYTKLQFEKVKKILF